MQTIKAVLNDYINNSQAYGKLSKSQVPVHHGSTFSLSPSIFRNIMPKFFVYSCLKYFKIFYCSFERVIEIAALADVETGGVSYQFCTVRRQKRIKYCY
jgi:hypothetical protein